MQPPKRRVNLGALTGFNDVGTNARTDCSTAANTRSHSIGTLPRA